MIASSAAPTAAALLASARVRLAGAPREPLGDWASSRRLLGFGRAPRIVPVDEVWHLGVLLLGDSAVYATGEVLRAREDVVRGFTAQSQRERAERAAAAFRGGFPDGATVHVGWTELDVAAVDAGGRSGPLDGANGILTVRWSAAAAPRALADYLDDLLTLAGR
ncbi:MAG: glutaminase [Candidatus Microbacterium phytovorans]|uniref:Glutaminase n=1 Tax=Candidatus Microbacterium phytovorans TaxID=3121374 RepID=A0AAJ5W2H5_9MICO|nr:glutaminase [Microbacterium sp.]WEK13486.1 MAG: glutaminase [Microbacterium sp.]